MTTLSHGIGSTPFGLAGSEDLRSGIWPRSAIVWLAGIYLALSVIRPWELLFPELGEIAFERCMVIAVVLAVLLTRGVALGFARQKVGVLALFVAVAISALTAFYSELATTELVEFLGIAVSFWVIVTVVRSPYQLFFLVVCYLVATSLLLAKAEWEYFFNGAAQYTMGVFRLRGANLTFGGPNETALGAVLSLPFLHLLIRNRRDLCASWPAAWRKCFSYYLVAHGVLCVSAILLTRSRSGMIGGVLFVLLLAWYREGFARKVKALSVGAIALVAVSVVMPEDMRYRLQSTWDPSVEAYFDQGGATSSAWGRWYGFLAGVEMFKRNPLTGVGIGNFKAYRLGIIDGEEVSAHNLPGELMGELGALGIAAFLFFLSALYANCRGLRRLRRSSRIRSVRVLGEFGDACEISLLLLLFAGLSAHVFQRYEWMWIAAFALLAITFCREGEKAGFGRAAVPGEGATRVSSEGPQLIPIRSR